MSLVLVALLYLLFHSTNHLLFKLFALEGLTPGESLLLRGMACLLITALIAFHQKKSLLPKRPSIQFFRVLVSGLAFLGLAQAYHLTDASSVALIQRTDVALLVLLTPALPLQKGLALLTLGGLFLLFPLTPLLIALAATFLLSLGFLLIKKSTQIEDFVVIPFYAGLSNVLFGSLFVESFADLNLGVLLFYSIASGMCMFLIYVLTVKLYQSLGVVKTEYLTLYSVVTTGVLENLTLQYVRPLGDWLGFGIELLALSLIVAYPRYHARKLSKELTPCNTP